MIERTIGSSPLSVGVVGLGCNNFSRPGTVTETLEGSIRVIHAAIDSGITFLDGADIYGGVPGRSEEYIGAALTDGRRDQGVRSPTFGHRSLPMPGTEDWGPKGARTYLRNAVEASLTRLRTDRIDLLQMHTPDDSTPIGDTLAALTELVDEGKVLAIGSSNFDAAQLREADAVGRENGFARFVSTQNEYSLLERGIEREVLPTAVELGLGVFPYFPLYNGLLTGKYTRDGGEGRITRQKPQLLEGVDWDRMDTYQLLCDGAGLPMTVVTFAWLLSRPGIVSVIAGATTPDQVVANAAAGSVNVSGELLAQVDRLFASQDAEGGSSR